MGLGQDVSSIDAVLKSVGATLAQEMGKRHHQNARPFPQAKERALAGSCNTHAGTHSASASCLASGSAIDLDRLSQVHSFNTGASLDSLPRYSRELPQRLGSKDEDPAKRKRVESKTDVEHQIENHLRGRRIKKSQGRDLMPPPDHPVQQPCVYTVRVPAPELEDLVYHHRHGNLTHGSGSPGQITPSLQYQDAPGDVMDSMHMLNRSNQSLTTPIQISSPHFQGFPGDVTHSMEVPNYAKQAPVTSVSMPVSHYRATRHDVNSLAGNQSCVVEGPDASISIPTTQHRHTQHSSSDLKQTPSNLTQAPGLSFQRSTPRHQYPRGGERDLYQVDAQSGHSSKAARHGLVPRYVPVTPAPPVHHFPTADSMSSQRFAPQQDPRVTPMLRGGGGSSPQKSPYPQRHVNDTSSTFSERRQFLQPYDAHAPRRSFIHSSSYAPIDDGELQAMNPPFGGPSRLQANTLAPPSKDGRVSLPSRNPSMKSFTTSHEATGVLTGLSSHARCSNSRRHLIQALGDAYQMAGSPGPNRQPLGVPTGSPFRPITLRRGQSATTHSVPNIYVQAAEQRDENRRYGRRPFQVPEVQVRIRHDHLVGGRKGRKARR